MSRIPLLSTVYACLALAAPCTASPGIEAGSGRQEMTPEIAMKIAGQVAPGSNIQSVVYAFPEFYAANAKNDSKATQSGYIRFNLNSFSEPGRTESAAAETQESRRSARTEES